MTPACSQPSLLLRRAGYCSSDAWLGDVGPSEATWDLSFRGQRIINATIQRRGPRIAQATRPQRVMYQRGSVPFFSPAPCSCRSSEPPATCCAAA